VPDGLRCSAVPARPTNREQFFEKEIATIRKREMALHHKNSFIKTINITLVFGTPPMTACVIFACYELMVGRLAATLAFTTLSLFNILRFPLVVLPKAVRSLSEALASINRVEGFMLEHVPTDTVGAVKSPHAGINIVSWAEAGRIWVNLGESGCSAWDDGFCGSTSWWVLAA
jgi:hypothetical protein